VWAPWGLRHVSIEGVDVSERHLEPEPHTGGKPSTQKLERTYLTCRPRLKRLVRKTLGFVKSVRLHDIVIGLCVMRDECGMVL
jgi:insertion element IS1 protein InsB